MSIPKLPENPAMFCAHVFSKKAFTGTYIKCLEKFYKRDDNGDYRLKKSVKSFLRNFTSEKRDDEQYGYDVMYEKVLALSKKLDESSLKKFIAGLKNIKKIFENYLKSKDKEKNKSKYVGDLNRYLGFAINYLEGWFGVDAKKLSNRDLAGYVQSLNKYTHFPEVAKLVKDFLNEIAERSKDPKQKKDIENHLRGTTIY